MYREHQDGALGLKSSLRHLYFNTRLSEKELNMEVTEFIVSFLLEANLCMRAAHTCWLES